VEQEKNKRKYCSAGGAPRGKLFASNWLEGISDVSDCGIVEVTFKNTRVGFYTNPSRLELHIGDIVAVEGNPGHDIGRVSMVGRLVRLQMRKNGVKDESELKKVFRIATQADMEKFEEARSKEHSTMIRTRKIAEELELNMKIGDVEYQGDGGKAIFYYIADERVDFRKLIRILADTFKIRVEMKQIGARQEAGRIGGIGPCGRPLCCASWMTHFVSVGTGAARIQDLSMNPQKLAGQCGKLKCCLNFETDVYVEAQKKMPPKDAVLETADASYYFFKPDPLAGTVTYSTDRKIPANLVTISVARAHEIIEMNRRGEKAEALQTKSEGAATASTTYVDLVEQESLTRFDKSKKKKKKKAPQKPGKKGPEPGKKGPEPGRKAPEPGRKGPEPKKQPDLKTDTKTDIKPDRGPRPDKPKKPRRKPQGPKQGPSQQPPQQNNNKNPE
jgi:cell fate regulator YaaT (PSP1 superfamily)